MSPLTNDPNQEITNKRRVKTPRWLAGIALIFMGFFAFNLAHVIYAERIVREIVLAIDVFGAISILVGLYLLYHPPDRIRFRYGGRPKSDNN